MFYLVKISKLSKPQKRRLLKGDSVRVSLSNSQDADEVNLTTDQIKKLELNQKLGKKYTLKLTKEQISKVGSGFLSDAMGYIKRNPVIREAINAGIRGGKKYAHKGVDYLSSKAHKKIEDFQGFSGSGVKKSIFAPNSKPVGRILSNQTHYKTPMHHTGEGLIGDLAGLLHPTAGLVAKSLGMGLAKKRTMKKGKGFLGDLAKSAVKSVAQKGIDAGASYLSNKVQGMGMKRKVTPKQLEHLAKARAMKKLLNKPRKTSGKHKSKGGALYVA